MFNNMVHLMENTASKHRVTRKKNRKRRVFICRSWSLHRKYEREEGKNDR